MTKNREQRDASSNNTSSLRSVAEAGAELARLRALEQDLRWDAQTMPAEQ